MALSLSSGPGTSQEFMKFLLSDEGWREQSHLIGVEVGSGQEK